MRLSRGWFPEKDEGPESSGPPETDVPPGQEWQVG